MTWKVREGNDAADFAKNAPDYGPNSDNFTIMMLHSGKIMDLGGTCYVGGNITYFDHCCVDEMSMTEITEMAREIHLDDWDDFFHDRSCLHDCSVMHLMQNDNDALELVNYLDDQRVAAICVKHYEQAEQSDQSAGEFEYEDDFPEVDEAIGYVGDVDEPVGDIDEPVDGFDEAHFDDDGRTMDELLEDVIDCNDSGGSDGQSVGDDSEHSDFLVDSEFFESDDDFQYDENIDCGVEWGGLGPDSESEEPRRSKRFNTGVETQVVDIPKKDQFMHHNYPVFNSNIDMENPQFQLGLCFPDAASFREAVRQHGRVNGRDIKLKLNEKYKVQAICKHETCPWFVYASQMRSESTFQIKTINAIHECPRKERVGCANSRWLASKYADKIRTDPNWPVDSMMAVAQKECKLLFSTHQMYRAKKKAVELNTGSSAEQFGMLWRYAEEIKKCSPKTTIRIKGKGDGDQMKFKRIYICWDALREGFLDGCRKIIFLDGCHLKSTYGGILLCAVGIDANNGMFPFAYAVVEKEKRDTWLWFMKLLKEDLQIENCGEWTIMSDKQKGLIDAIEELMPNSEHRFCVMHLYSNFKLSHRGLALKNILWQAARATRVVDFNRIMRDLSGKDKAAFQWLAKRPAAHWSRCFFRTNSKCDTLLNNMCESFNSMILRPRSMGIIDMLEAVRKILMKRIHVKRDKMEKFNGNICPNIQKQIEEWKKKSMEFIAHWNGQAQFEIENCYGDRFKVNLEEKTCSCKRWQLSGIPCAHAISGLYYMGKQPEDYVEQCYSKETYMRVYSHLMDTLEGPDNWPISAKPPLLPPEIEKMTGRPKLHKRRKQPGETSGSKDIPAPVAKTITTVGKLGRQGVLMTCSLCKQKKHNAKGCPLNKGKQSQTPQSTQATEANITQLDSQAPQSTQATEATITQLESQVTGIEMASEKNDKRKRTQAAVKNATARNKLPTTRKAKEKIMQENEPTRKEKGKGKEPMMSVITKARNQQIDGSSPSQNLRPRNKKGLVTRSQQAHVARNQQSQPKSVRRRLIDEDD